jgi:hypothetical protein
MNGIVDDKRVGKNDSPSLFIDICYIFIAGHVRSNSYLLEWMSLQRGVPSNEHNIL